MERQKPGLQGCLAKFSRAVQDRFPDKPRKFAIIQEQVLNPVASGKNPEDYLEFVQLFLHDAKDIAKDFELIATTFGGSVVENWRQSTPNQNPEINLRRSAALFATPRVTLGGAASTSPADASLTPTSLLPALASPSYPQYRRSSEAREVSVNSTQQFQDGRSSSAPQTRPSIEQDPSNNIRRFKDDRSSLATRTRPSIEEVLSNNTQQFQDDSRRDDVQNLLVLSEVNIPPSKRRQTPRQMSCTLTEHQKIGLTYLLEQERDPQKNGCLLADTMGLGKTVQAMALILANPPKNQKQKTTLIVAPLALLRQWEKEILTKIKPRHKLSTLVFHGPVAKDMTISEVLRYDVVLCTYAKLQTEFKNKHEHKQPRKVKLLAEKTQFHRVILDEAHNIRNQTTYCSKAAAEIKSTYRLCMTGTPFMNRAEEIFPLIRFLRIAPYKEWERFSEDIVRPLRKWDGDGRCQAMVKLQALFRSFTLRRTKESRLDGKPIIELPPRIDQPAYVEFKEEQRQFYQALEVRQRLVFNKYLLNGAVMKNYMHILILLLRLRQACDHPFLLKNVGIPEGAKLDDKQMVKLACKLPADVLQRLKKEKSFKCLLCNEETNNPVIVVPCGHHVCSSCFTASVAVVETEGFADDREDDTDGPRKKPRVPCPGEGSQCEHSITPTNIVCYNFLGDIPDSTHEPDDDHFQKDWLLHDDRDEADADRDEADADSKGNLRGFVVEDDNEVIAISSDDEDDLDDSDHEGGWKYEEHEADGDGPMAYPDVGVAPFQTDGAFDDALANNEARKPKRKSSSSMLGGSSGKKPRKSGEAPNYIKKKKPKAPKKKKVVTMADQRQVAQRSAVAMSRYKARLRKEWISSAKIDAIMDILRRIRPSGEKTLVFSLWTSFLDLVEIPIERAGVSFTRYDGSMTPGAREAAVRSFMEDPRVRVMLVSLTAGNAGLNLTAASQVIVTEPFWNPFVEEQAIDRAHRFGQKRPVTVHRLLIPGTVEDRIVALQESKKMLVDEALSEKGAARVSRLSVGELKSLFGFPVER